MDGTNAESVNAMLAIMERMLEDGQTASAGKYYRGLYEQGKTPNIRMAGLKGMMAAGSGGKEKLLISALGGRDDEIRGFAGRLIGDRSYGVETKKLIKKINQLPNDGKRVLIDALGHRGATEHKGAVLKYGNDPDPEIQTSVIRTLGYLGGVEDIAFLAKKAAGGEKDIREAAMVSLSRLNEDGTNGQMLALLPSSEPPVLITSLTNRSAAEAKETLMPYLESPDGNVRKSVLAYLREQGEADDLPVLIDFVDRSEERSEVRLASRAVSSICAAHGKACQDPVLNNLDRVEKGTRTILLGSLNLINTPEALKTTIRYTRDKDREIKRTALRTLSEWQDSTAMEELKKIMNEDPDQGQRIIAFRGYFRLFRNSATGDQEKMREYHRLIQQAERKEEKLLVLSAFQDIGNIDALKRIEKYLYDEDMSHETCVTLLRISDFLDPKYRADVAIAMMQILQVSEDENVLADVQRRFDKFEIDPLLYFDPPGREKEPGEKRIVFISGPMDHAWYNAHEYPKDLLFLKQCMENSPDLEDVRIDFYITPEALDLDLLEGADAIVVHSSADRASGEVHSLFPNHRQDMQYTDQEKKYYHALDQLVSSGMGVVALHYSVWTDFPESREYMTKWVGGYYDDDVSKVRMDSCPVRLESPSHPVNNGVKPWHLREEYYINQVHQGKQVKFTPLMAAELPLNRGDEPAFHTMAWTVERRDGGRGAGYTGCHTHSHLYREDYRKFVVNLIAWTSGIPIPESGIRTEMPEGWPQ